MLAFYGSHEDLEGAPTDVELHAADGYLPRSVSSGRQQQALFLSSQIQTPDWSFGNGSAQFVTGAL